MKQSRHYEDEREVAAELSSEAAVNRSTAMMSVLVIISRLTGFLRTWGQALALGVTMVASCYTVANNLPNQLYELVLGGLISTAFLPVYVSLKRQAGKARAHEYASNLISIVVVLMALVCILGFIFAYEVVLTQSAGAQEGFDYNLAVFFFRFFVIEVILYALSSLFSGLLNAERDYFWSNAAPIFNNLICIASFVGAWWLYGSAQPTAAAFVLAVGNPLGVLVQVLLQLPSLKKKHIVVRPHINLHDSALKETLLIGVPSVIAMICSFVTVSVQSSYALSVTVQGAAIIYYARLWYTLPYAILAIPVTIALFTELSDAFSQSDTQAFKRALISGINRILFFLVPFAFYLIVFAPSLIALFNTGSFTQEDIQMTSGYLVTLALALPFYGLSTFFQKVCSSYRKMFVFAAATVAASAAQVVFCVIFTPIFGLYAVGISSLVCFGVSDAITYLKLRKDFGGINSKAILASGARSFILGGIGALVGFVCISILTLYTGIAPTHFSAGILCCLVGGIPALIVTYGLAYILKVPEVAYLKSMRHHRHKQ